MLNRVSIGFYVFYIPIYTPEQQHLGRFLYSDSTYDLDVT